MEEKDPKVTVVTVSFNAEKSIEATIHSVLHQNYSNLEYIIIDGKSTDKTIEIVKKYKKSIDVIISEEDNGIYDAMNKGIDVATGDWLIFMNAGDCFADEYVIEDVFKDGISSTIDVIFGNVINVYSWGKVKSYGRYFNGKEPRLPFSHQSTFVRTELLKNYRFNTNFISAADHDLLFRIYTDGHKFLNKKRFIAEYDVYGLSSTSMRSYKEVAKINNTPKLNYVFGYLKAYFRNILVTILPPKWVSRFQHYKYSQKGLLY